MVDKKMRKKLPEIINRYRAPLTFAKLHRLGVEYKGYEKNKENRKIRAYFYYLSEGERFIEFSLSDMEDIDNKLNYSVWLIENQPDAIHIKAIQKITEFISRYEEELKQGHKLEIIENFWK